MKKCIMALAVAFAVPAFANSNAEIYGVMSTAVQNYNNGSEKLTRFNDGVWSVSRLGFRGVEKIDSNLSIKFNLEGQITNSTGQMGSTTVATNEVFNRESWVGFNHASLGEVRFGRQDVTFAQDFDFWIHPAGNQSIHPTNGTSPELGTDQKGVIKWISPKVANVTLEAGFGTNTNAATTDAGTDQWGVAAYYAAGPVKLGVGTNKLNATTQVAERDYTVVGASYDFGFANVGVTYGKGDTSTTSDAEAKVMVASVSVPLNLSTRAYAFYGKADAVAQTTNKNGKGFGFGLKRDLSKRTFAFATYASVTNEANSSMSFGGTSAPASAGLDPKVMTVGLVHSF